MRRIAVVGALAMFAGITVALVSVDDPSEAIGELYVVPVALLAFAYELPGGLAAAAAGLLAEGLWDAFSSAHISALGYGTRGIGLFVMGATVGLAARRARRHGARARAGEEQLGLLVEGAADHALVLLDANGCVTTWNRGAQRLFGWRPPEIVGQPADVLFPPQDRDRGRPATLLRQAAQRGRVVDEGWRVRSDGAWFVAETTLSALRDRDQASPRGFVQVVHDISERREIENALRGATVELGERARELERSNAELERFAAVASHDLSEPLHTVTGFAELLRARHGDRLDDGGRDLLDQILAGAARMRGLIDALLAYARAGRGSVAAEDVDAAVVVDEVVAALRGRLEAAGGEVVRDGLPVVRGDRALLRQLFQNLIANALKFRGSEPPRVTVSAQPAAEGRWTFTVADNGPGLAPDQRAHVFEMFARAHGDDYEGTGMGLAICAKIATRHGGEIWADEAPGGGAAFRFTLSGAEPPAGPDG